MRRRPAADPSGAPTPVVFVHGAFANGHLWDGVAAALDGRPDLDLVLPDLPMGAHHRPMTADADLSLGGLARIVLDVADALDLDRLVVVGNDSGGAITQVALGTVPDRFAGALLTPTETAEHFPPGYFRFLFPPLRLRSLMWATARLLRTDVGRRLPLTFGHLIRRRLPAAEAERMMGPLWRSAGARDDLRRVLRSVDAAELAEASARFDEVRASVDVAWVAGDRIFPDADADLLAAAFPNGRRVADIDASLSLVPLDQPAAVADRLVDLVARVRAVEPA